MKEENTNPGFPIPKDDIRGIIQTFLSPSKKLFLIESKSSEKVALFQDYDKKRLFFSLEDIDEVLERKDIQGKDFLQLNFKNGKKIILTDEFIGFAPAPCAGIPLRKLPKVVTTADLLSVIEAIESSIYGIDHYQESLEDIRLFFEAIAGGAESIGLDLTGERLWVERIIPKALLS